MLWGTLQGTAFGDFGSIQIFDQGYKLADSSALFPVSRIDPARLRRCLGARNIQVDDDRLLAAAHHHRFHRDVRVGIDFLVRNVGRNEDEVAGSGLIDEFQLLAPAESSAAFDDIQYRFEIPVVVGSGLRVGLNDDRSGPQLAGARARMVDRGGACHPFGLGRVAIQFVGVDDADAVALPIGFGLSAHRAADVRAGASFASADALRFCRSRAMARHSSASSLELVREQRLESIGESAIGIGMHLDDQTRRARGHGSQRHGMHLVALAGAMARIYDNRQVAEFLHGRHHAEIQRITRVVGEGAHAALA